MEIQKTDNTALGEHISMLKMKNKKWKMIYTLKKPGYLILIPP